MHKALARCDELSPGGAMAYEIVGENLSTARQYDLAETMLRTAIKRQPNWAQPHVELGLMLMQAGKEPEALEELRRADALDPFNRRARNSLALAQDLKDYKRIESDHFIIKWTNPIDAALASDMPEELERIYDEVTRAFSYRPEKKTTIEILPDAEHFAVRITGLPDIWTIAACTGDVIAITPPRIGAGQKGDYDWANVIQHEYTHTVTLGKTKFRIPHWFTEACAVSQERIRRDYNTCQLLAAALQTNQLFDLDDVNWAFVRPKKPSDRALAYAQSDWMLEYVTTRFGHRAVLKLLDRFGEGESDVTAMAEVTGQDAKTFVDGFKAWAKKQVADWGLAPPPDDPRLAILESADLALTDQHLTELIAAFPNEPRLLRIDAERALRGADADRAWEAVLRYAAARPVDPWPHRELVKLALSTGRLTDAIGSLEELDRMETESGRWALQLAKAERSLKQYDAAADAIGRALHREPYNAEYRELAAAIDLQRGNLPEAAHQIRALTAIEPDRGLHFVRLAAVYSKMGEKDKASEAAKQALELDPNAPVQSFIQP